MKKILFVFTFVLVWVTTSARLFGQDIYYANKDETLYMNYTTTIGISKVYEGEIINVISTFVGSYSDEIDRVEVKTEDGRMGWLATEAISVKYSIALPKEITVKKWTHSYYLEVLRSENRETMFTYEPFWRDRFDEYKSRTFDDWAQDYTWGEMAFTNYMNFTNIYVRIYEHTSNLYEFINGKIFKKDGTYIFFATCIRKLDDYNESDLEKYFSVNKEVKIALRQDGDYLDVFINDKKLFSLIELTDVIQWQFKYLMSTDATNNYFDLSKITSWPRRADGSMDYPPPITVADTTIANDTQEEPVDTARDDETPNHIDPNLYSTGTNSMPLWLWIAIAGGAIAVAGGVVFIVKRKK